MFKSILFLAKLALLPCISLIEGSQVPKLSLESLALKLSTVENELNAMREDFKIDSLKEQVRQLIALNGLLPKDNNQTKKDTYKVDEHILQDDIEERVEKLEELSRVGTLRTCNEYSAYGIKTSGKYTIDPDGPLVGEPPFSAYCQFDQNGQVRTEIFHDSEILADVDHCHDPGCSNKEITYVSAFDGEPIPLTQLDALIALSSSCDQTFHYECTLAPLRAEGIDYGFWIGRDGETNVYFTGNDSSLHACDCHYTEQGCIEEELKQNTCNCDANLPAPLIDTGLISNMSALPIMGISFGGLTYEIQQGAYKIGRLSCQGVKPFEKATSCESLKLAGETHSGYFTIKKIGSLRTSSVYCDMDEGGYNNVPENTELTTDSPLGTIVAWIPRNNITSDMNNLPVGWLPCDGRLIEKGLWTGGHTPELNNDGYFLRGGSMDTALEMEEDQVLDHDHTDPGHTHGNSPHSHSYNTREGPELIFTKGTQYHADYLDVDGTTAEVTITIATAKTNMGMVSAGFKTGGETRPRNMKTLWLIKVW